MLVSWRKMATREEKKMCKKIDGKEKTEV